MNKSATDSVLLRTFREDDQARLARLCNNRNIWDNVRDLFPSPYSKQNAIEFIELCQKQDPPVTFAIEYNRELVGCIGLTRQEDVYRMSAEIGYWIGEPYWGRGIATQSVGLLVDYAFNTLDLVRVYTGVFDFNLASQRVLEKSGFKFEGEFEKSVLKNGRFCNEYRFAKVRED
jgi:RimJ/RimL family protein N-acetyltransferase